MRRPTHGTLLQLGDAYDVFTNIAQVITLTPPGLTAPPIVMRDHDMEEVAEKIPQALSDVSSVTARVYLDPQNATHEELYALARSKEVSPWKVVLPSSGGEWNFDGWVGGFEVGEASANDGVLEATITIEVVGVPELS